VAAVLGGLVGVSAVAAAGEQFIPVLGTREGAQRSTQIPQANGYIDYLTLLNARDGGINGVPLVWEECVFVGGVPGRASRRGCVRRREDEEEIQREMSP
jgi:hypothetical protein